MKNQILKAVAVVFAGIALLFCAATFSGCATPQPGADPVVVRAEQIQTIALATFDTFLQLDEDNLEFFRRKLPAAHQFAEWLREEKNGRQRGLAMLDTLSAAKLLYKTTRANSGPVITAISILESNLQKAQGFISEASTSIQPQP